VTLLSEKKNSTSRSHKHKQLADKMGSKEKVFYKDMNLHGRIAEVPGAAASTVTA
jgi:hypothetical protein